MATALGAIAAVAYWDAARESEAALQDFAEEQATLAGAIGVALGARSAAAGDAAGGADHLAPDRLLLALRTLERPASLALLLRHADEGWLRTTGGLRVLSPRLIAALDAGESVVRIPRDEAPGLGLPARTAMAGLARLDGPPAGRDAIVVVASAERERDRGVWARRRLLLSVSTAAGLVLAFGGLAMRNQRKELLLERELAIAALQQSRDERLQRVSKAAVMGTLAMGVAHEISTPLGVIAARAEQMRPRVADDERLSAAVAAILGQTERIAQVMRGLLGLARGDAPSAERIEPRTIVANAVGLVEHRFTKAGVQLAEDVAPALPPLLGDPRLLEHAVVNLLLNACDACKPGGRVTITAARVGPDVELSVEDSGAGISLADVDRALEPFFTTKAREGGTGLGLAIAHEIVASHRGRLVFSQARPTGTRVAILLPCAEEAARG